MSKTGPNSTATATLAPETGPRDRVLALAVSLAATLLVAVTNLWSPHDYTWLAWDYHSYFTPSSQVLWGSGCLALCWGWFLGWRWFERQRGVAAVLLLVLPLAVVASFHFFQTPYPGLNGDHYLILTYRLRSLITCVVNQCFFRGLVLDRAIVWTEALFGVVYIATAIAWTWRVVQDPWTRVAFAGFLLFVPQLLTAYGHIDGYTSALPTQFLWWAALWEVDRRSGTAGFRRGVELLVYASLLAWYASPLHILLVGLGGFYLVNRWMGKGFPLRAASAGFLWLLPAIALGVAIISFPVVARIMHYPQVYQHAEPMDWIYCKWFVHSCSMNFLAICMPGAVLLAWLWLRKAPWREPRCALTNTAMLGMLTALLCRFSLPFSQGINDEFSSGAVGFSFICGSLVLFLKWVPSSSGNALMMVTIFAIYLHVPKVLVYASDRYLERYRSLYPHDRCHPNNVGSPYLNLFLMFPKEQSELRLGVLREGYETHIEHWKPFRIRNLVWHTAWCYEYGQIEKGREALSRLIEEDPVQPAGLFSKTTFETRQAGALIRRDVKPLLLSAYRRTRDPIYGQLLNFLTDVQRIYNEAPDTPS